MAINKEIKTFDNAREDLYEDFLALCEKYDAHMPVYEFGYAMLQYTAKMLMDCAPRNQVGIETINAGTKSGIDWHLEDQKEKHGWKKRDNRRPE